VVWFRNDLRLHDNYVVSHAAKFATEKEVLPVYCFDPRHFTMSRYGFPKMSSLRGKFLLQSVLDLKKNLKAIGSDLLICFGKPEIILPTLVSAECQKTTFLCSTEVCSEETGVDKAVEAAISQKSSAAKLERIWNHTLYHPDDLPTKCSIADFPSVFTKFRNAVEKDSAYWPAEAAPARGSLPFPDPTKLKSALGQFFIPGDVGAAASDELAESGEVSSTQSITATSEGILSPGVLPSLSMMGFSPQDVARAEQVDARGVFGETGFVGGESVALARLQGWMWDRDCLKEYFNTRNGMIGADYSTKFSPWLALGCLSPRFIAAECKRYETERITNKSTYWVVFELLWRDYFRFFAWKNGNKIFYEWGLSGQNGRPAWVKDQEQLQAWVQGKTGMPLVDANMRELAATGFMSNRGRQNVASYLVLDLGIDWRYGAAYFEYTLLDHDVTSNWGNWIAAAGLSSGRVNKFNIPKQSKDYDRDGSYVRHWLPELKAVPLPCVHSPQQMNKAQMERAGCIIGEDYPYPLVSKAKPSHARDGENQRGKYGAKDHQRGQKSRGGSNSGGTGNKARKAEGQGGKSDKRNGGKARANRLQGMHGEL
jgi:deoxyribodipyrimidine photo-lyase